MTFEEWMDEAEGFGFRQERMICELEQDLPRAERAGRLVAWLKVAYDVGREQALSEAREAFFGLIADARRWDEDVDGDIDSDGRTQITITHFAEFHDSSLGELIETLGVKRRYDETARDALDRAMEIPK